MNTKRLGSLAFVFLIAVSSCVTPSSIQQRQVEGPESTTDNAPQADTVPVVTPEMIRQRNAELLGEITEDQIRADLEGKMIYAEGPEEGDDRNVSLAWTVFSVEIKKFEVQSVDGDDAQRDIVVNVVFDDTPKSQEYMEGPIRIRYVRDGEQWRFDSVRRAGEAMQYRK